MGLLYQDWGFFSTNTNSNRCRTVQNSSGLSGKTVTQFFLPGQEAEDGDLIHAHAAATLLTVRFRQIHAGAGAEGRGRSCGNNATDGA